MEINLLYFIEAFVTLLIMVNPIGVIPPYLNLTSDLNRIERRLILKQAMIFAIGIMIVTVFVGKTLLTGLGIDTFALQIAGGILFFKFGYDILNGKTNVPKDESPGLVPLGFPLIAGPGSITALIVMTSQYNNFELYAIVAIILVLALTFVIMYFAKAVVKLLGLNATMAVVKIMGLLIISRGIQLILSGLQSWVLKISLNFV
ncbi:MarC family protein [archaeon]|nr:MarC family protein [archaeon]NDB78420.1 MarC family protein [archaeon]